MITCFIHPTLPPPLPQVCLLVVCVNLYLCIHTPPVRFPYLYTTKNVWFYLNIVRPCLLLIIYEPHLGIFPLICNRTPALPPFSVNHRNLSSRCTASKTSTELSCTPPPLPVSCCCYSFISDILNLTMTRCRSLWSNYVKTHHHLIHHGSSLSVPSSRFRVCFASPS
jgi:hypothetical protein